MEMLIAEQALREASDDLALRLPQEGCGVFCGIAGKIDTYLPLNNVSRQAESAFELDPAEWIHLLYHCERNGQSLLGFVHSHPTGQALPSRRDAEGWLYDIPTYWIIAYRGQRSPIVRAYTWSDSNRANQHGTPRLLPYRLMR